MKNKTDWKRTVLSVLFLILAILTDVLAVYFELRDTGRLVAQMGVAVCLAISLILMFGGRRHGESQKTGTQVEKLRGGYPAEGIPAAFFHI